MLPLVTVALAAKSVLVAAAVLETDRWAALVALSALPLIALLVAPALLLAGRARTAYLVGADVLVTTVLLADLLNVRASGRLLSLHMVAAAGSFEGLSSSVLAMFRWSDALLYADLLLLLGLAVTARWRTARPRAVVPRLRPRTVALVAAGAVLAFVGQVMMQSSDPGLRVVALSPLGAHAHEAYDELVDTNRELEPGERRRVADWMARNAAYLEVAPENADLVGLLEGRDVYLVQFESLEEVVLGSAPFGQEVTPTLNGWAEESLVFDHVVQQVRDGSSSDGELLMVGGVYPVQQGAAFMRFPDNRGYPSLPKLVAGEGYHPVALHGDAETFWNRDRVFPHLGYERYVGEEDFALGGTQIGLGLADSDLFDQALHELERVPQPRFMHLITTTSHTPWELPERLQALDLPDDDATSRYLQTVHYTDAELGRFAGELEDRGLLERSAIVVVGDHQGPHRYLPDDEVWIGDNGGRVPFMVYVPGMDGRRISTPGGQVDVLPTLAQLLGVPQDRYAGRVMGRTLLGPTTGSAVTSEGEVLPGADGADLLRDAYEVADLAITGDWFVAPR